MKKLLALGLIGLCTLGLLGCPGADAPKANEKQKAEIDRIMKEGIGAPGDNKAGGTAEAQTPNNVAPPDSSTP
ncbi:MAG: hypothetical protein KIS66_12730 [Fimbriimonadaceae bacterium]|nr:hypothetical protein [Fimbriimonadaceae bacterium]